MARAQAAAPALGPRESAANAGDRPYFRHDAAWLRHTERVVGWYSPLRIIQSGIIHHIADDIYPFGNTFTRQLFLPGSTGRRDNPIRDPSERD